MASYEKDIGTLLKKKEKFKHKFKKIILQKYLILNIFILSENFSKFYLKLFY